MANLADKSGDAYSNIVQGTGTATATFVMPGTVPLAVSSVVATVDNAAGGDTRATLVIRDQAGEVIATKRQGDVIPAGDTGTATWALRLDDDLTGFIRFDFENVGGFLHVTTTTGDVSIHSATDVVITADSDSINLLADQYVRLFLDGSFFVIEKTTNTQRFVVEANGQTSVHLSTGGKLEVTDHNGAAIFRVNEDGSLQGKTGKALTFNL